MTTAPIDLVEAMRLLPRSRHPLAPIYEAVGNGLEAIALRQRKYGAGRDGLITVTWHFVGLLENASKLSHIEVTDNGIGFTDENYARFKLLLDRTKGFNNRGSGRIQYLHRANLIEIESVVRTEDATISRRFQCDSAKYVTQCLDEAAPPNTETGSKVTLSDLKYSEKEREYIETLDAASLRNDLRNHFLLRLYLDLTKGAFKVPEIHIAFVKAGVSTEPARIVASDITAPQATGDFKVDYVKAKDPKSERLEWVPVAGKQEVLNWAHFKLPDTELPENEVVLCSKNVTVQKLPFKEIKKGEAVAGHRFLTAIFGDVLDDPNNVSHAVDSFTFPKRDEIEKSVKEGGDLFLDTAEPVLFFDTIREGVDRVLPFIHGELLQLQKSQVTKAEEIAKAHGIPLEVVKSADIKLTDSEEQITIKLYRAQADRLARHNQRLKDMYESLVALNPMSEGYRDELEKRSHELLDYIPKQNKEELARYVIRRDMVSKVLKLILDNALAVQEEDAPRKKGQKKRRFDREGLIHDLIFKRKQANTNGPNDLWVLNEEFVHFEGCSELPLNQIKDGRGEPLLRPITAEQEEDLGVKPGRRPDVFLYPEEGKCVLIEFKEPNVDLSDHLQQLIKYSNLIANFSVRRITSFHCYLIGENIKRADLGGDFRATVSGDWIRDPFRIMSLEKSREEEEIARGQLEVIKLSAIHDRARRRNKSFAEKLGLEGSSSRF